MQHHSPPQVLLPGETVYFVSARTYGGLPYFASSKNKNTFKEILFSKAEKFCAELKQWVILGNHYHFLAEFTKGELLPNFVKELHGASSFAVKKFLPLSVPNEEQVFLRKITPMEKRMEERVEDVVAHFSARPSLDFNQLLEEMNFSQETKQKLSSPEIKEMLTKAIINNNFFLFKSLFLANMPEIPFWYRYLSHVIRDEKDYFYHFNYIVQNPVKHGLVKNPWQYEFSGIFAYTREEIIDSLRKYPIVDFGGSYE